MFLLGRALGHHIQLTQCQANSLVEWTLLIDCGGILAMKMLFDFLPVLLFFTAYKFYDLYVATAVLMAASLLQTVVWWLIYRRFEKMHVITLVLVCLLGGATLLLHDEMFIKWKPTIVNWLFAAAFVGSHFIGKKVLVKRMMSDHIHLPEMIWLRLNIAWTIFFVAMGALNLFVVYNFDTETWVNFKMFGLLGLTFAFVIAQSVVLSRHMQAPDDANSTTSKDP